MAWIRNKNGQQLCEVKKLSYNGVFMDVASITVTVESAAPIDFSIGDYIEWDYDGLRYTLDTAAGVEKVARRNTIGNAFVYENLVFLSPLKAADNVDFLDVILGNTVDFLTNTEFSFYGTAWDYAKRLEANLCRLYGSGSWKVRIWTNGVCYDTTPATLDTGSWESKLVDVSKIKCLGGFRQIYDLWGCAYVFSVENGVNYVDFYDDFEQYAQTWKQGGIDKIFAYGKGNGLYKIRHTPDADHVLVTRLRAYGSSENLSANYYLNSPDYHVDGNESSELAIANLMLPASEWTKDGVKAPMNAYLEQNTAIYGVREASVAWDGTDEELGEIKPSIYGLTIQDLLDLMSPGDSYRPVVAKWPDTSQRIDKIITGAAPADNGAVAESGYDFTVVEAQGAFSANELSAARVYNIVDFGDLTMATIPSVGHLADYRVVPTSENVKVASFDVPASVIGLITDVNAYITPYVNGVKIDDATIPCLVSSEVISREVSGVEYTKRYYIHLLDANSAAVVFSTMRTGAVTFKIQANITYSGQAKQVTVLRNEYAVNFNLLRGNKAIDKFFSVVIPQIGFDLSAAMTGSAKLCMRSGYNQPREFPIAPSSVRYDSATDTWYLRCKRVADQSTKTYFPNSDAVIATGDEYYFSGIAMPALYVEIAARKLLKAAKAWLELHSKPRMLSSVDVDNKIMAVEGIVLREGMSLPLNDADLAINPETQESRIIDNIRIEEGENAIRTFSITLRDKKEKSSIDSAIRGATSGLATSASVSEAVSAAESRDHDALTGRDMPNQHPISAITGLEDALATLTFFEEDGNGGVKLKDEYAGLWAKGYVTAGGVGSGGGGGGDVDLPRVWESLTNNTDFPDTEINPAHIPDISWSKITSGKPTTLAGYGIADAKFGTAGVDYVPITLGATIKNVLTAHQSLSGYATETWVGQQGFITKAVNDLTNYYTKTQTYTRAEVNDLIGSINQFHYEIAASTGAVTDPQSNVLYLIGPTGSGSDKYEEYVYTTQWVKIGDTSIDLTPYLTKTLAAQTYQPIISDLATIRSNAEHGETAYNNFTTVSEILQSLQAQIDSVSSRDTFDELAATVFYSDVAAVSDLYVGAVSLNGVDLAGSLSSLASRATSLESRATALEGRATSLEGRATTLESRATALEGRATSLESRASTLESYFTNGVANSALRLSGTATYSIWGVEYWSSGVPKSVTGRPGLYIGTTQVQTSAASQDLNGIAAINASGLATIAGGIKLTTTKKIYFGDTDHYLELDSNGFHFSHGVYSEDFVTAGGIGSGGGGGDMDIDRMWQSLTNNPADQGYENTKIAQAHIPDMATTYGYLKGNQTITLTGVVTGSGTTSIATSIADGALSIAKVSGLQAALDSKTGNTGTVTSVGLSVPTGLSVSGSPITTSGTLAITFASGYSIPTTAQQSAWSGKQDAISDLATIRSNAANGATAYNWGNHASAGYLTSANGATISQALQSLQSQVDSVATRDTFDELTATVLNADTLTATSAYIGTVNGSLSGNATTASYLVSASYGIGGGLNPIYFSGGRPVASTSTAGSASVPVYLDGGTLTAITPSSLFSALSSSAATNLSVTIAGQVRTIADLYARYDKDGGEIATNMTTIGTALRSLQSQVDSVASRDRFDELNATVLFTDMLSVGADALVGGTLKVFGAATLGGSLSVAGAASITGTLGVSSTANLYGALNVSGLATIAGGIKITTTKKIWFDDTHYLELKTENGIQYLHTNLTVVSDAGVVAGAAANS